VWVFLALRLFSLSDNFQDYTLFTKKYHSAIVLIATTEGHSIFCAFNKREEKAFIPLVNFLVLSCKPPRFIRRLKKANQSEKSKLARVFWFISQFKNTPDSRDFWQYPMETLSRKAGDCEDKAFLLFALCDYLGIDIKVTLGYSNIRGQKEPHAWITHAGGIYDATFSNIKLNLRYKYTPLVSWNKIAWWLH